MQSLRIFSLVLLLVSGFSVAEPLREIKIFQSDTSPVNTSAYLSEARVTIQVYNLSDKKRTDQKLNRMVKARVSGVTSDNVQEKYQAAFMDLLNGPEWEGLAAEYKQSTVAIEKAIRFQIKKVPAIVFNDRDVVYGVASLGEAVRIYKEKGGAR